MSTKKCFGEFLVDKQILSQDELLGVLIEHVRGQPTVVDVILSRDLLSKRDVIRALSHQSEVGCDFVSALHALELWTDSIGEGIRAELTATQIPICEILIARNMVSVPVLTSAVDDYLALGTAFAGGEAA